jgi:hypothetical protein
VNSLLPHQTLAILVRTLPMAALGMLLVTSHTDAQIRRSDRTQLELDRLRRETLLQASPEVSPDQRAVFDYGAYFTFDYLSVEDNLNDNHVLRQYDLVAYTRLNIDGAHELFLRYRATYDDFNDRDSFDGRGDEFHSHLDLGYYRFNLARYLGAYKGQEIDGNVVVEFGRDIVYWGNGLTLAQVIDGTTINLTKGPFEIDVVAGVTPDFVVDYDASRPDFDVDTRRGFYGIMASAQVGDHKPYAYALFQQDYNSDRTLELGTVTTKFQYNSYYLGLGSSGNIGDRIAYGAEMVYEGGHGESNSFTVNGPFLTPVDQTKDDICAFAADFRLDYLMPDTRKTRLSGEVLLATGDDDRLHTSDTFGGNKPNTNDKAFNAFGIINTGLAFAPVASNLLMARVGASTYPFSDFRPLKNLQIGADVFVYGKFDTDAPIDEPTRDGRYLGWEPDLYLNWQLTSDVTLALRYGVFFPGSDAFFDDSSRQFISTSVTFAF